MHVGGLAAVGSGDIRMYLPSVVVQDEAEADLGSRNRTVGVTIVCGGFRNI